MSWELIAGPELHLLQSRTTRGYFRCRTYRNWCRRAGWQGHPYEHAVLCAGEHIPNQRQQYYARDTPLIIAQRRLHTRSIPLEFLDARQCGVAGNPGLAGFRSKQRRCQCHPAASCATAVCQRRRSTRFLRLAQEAEERCSYRSLI